MSKSKHPDLSTMFSFIRDCSVKHFKSDPKEGDLFFPYPGSISHNKFWARTPPNNLEDVGYKITCPIVFDEIKRFIKKDIKFALFYIC